MIKIEHLRNEYPLVTPLKDVSVTVNDGDVISVIGPSGTGKSTFIRCINMLETPTSGNIWVDGECITDKKCNVSKVRRKMGMVFQSFNLFNHMNVIDNVMAAPVDLLKMPKEEAYNEGMRLLRTVGLADKAQAGYYPFRRAHFRARPDNGGRGAIGYPRPRGAGTDNDNSHPRNALCP